MAKIFVLSGPDVGMSFDVQDGAAFGRASECAVVLRHSSVSRKHAHLEIDGGSWWIVDESSRNGLTVDGQRVLRAPLEDGDEFQLGEVQLRFRLPSAAAATVVSIEPPVGRPAMMEAESDEIVLEGEWDPTAVVADVPRRSIAANPPPAPEIARMETARERATAKLAAAGALPAAQNTRGILQYKKVEARPGFLGAELGQQPWWIKLTVTVLVLVVFAAVAWVAFRGTLWVRGPAQPGVSEESAAEEAR